jgi:hypothetical protein
MARFYRADWIIQRQYIVIGGYTNFLGTSITLGIHLKRKSINLEDFYAIRFVIQVEAGEDFDKLNEVGKDIGIHNWIEVEQSEYDSIIGISLLDQKLMKIPFGDLSVIDSLYSYARLNEKLNETKKKLNE